MPHCRAAPTAPHLSPRAGSGTARRGSPRLTSTWLCRGWTGPRLEPRGDSGGGGGWGVRGQGPRNWPTQGANHNRAPLVLGERGVRVAGHKAAWAGAPTSGAFTTGGEATPVAAALSFGPAGGGGGGRARSGRVGAGGNCRFGGFGAAATSGSGGGSEDRVGAVGRRVPTRAPRAAEGPMATAVGRVRGTGGGGGGGTDGAGGVAGATGGGRGPDEHHAAGRWRRWGDVDVPQAKGERRVAGSSVEPRAE